MGYSQHFQVQCWSSWGGFSFCSEEICTFSVDSHCKTDLHNIVKCGVVAGSCSTFGELRWDLSDGMLVSAFQRDPVAGQYTWGVQACSSCVPAAGQTSCALTSLAATRSSQANADAADIWNGARWIFAWERAGWVAALVCVVWLAMVLASASNVMLLGSVRSFVVWSLVFCFLSFLLLL